jgi:O-antigen/teichoic acid export membrane protein
LTQNSNQKGSFGAALFYSFAGKYLSIAMQLIGSIVLARIIPPEDYGLFAVALIFAGFAAIVKEFGVNNYLVKQKTLSPEIISSAYGTSLVISSIVAISLFFLSYLLAQFFEEPELVPILHLLSLNILLSTFGSIIDCLLKRQLLFKPALITNVSSQFLSVVGMIILALNGFGVYSLVYGSLIQTISQSLIFQFFRPANMPLWPSLKKSREILSYSKFVGFTGVVNYFSAQFNVLLSGKFFTLEVTGLLSRANSTVSLFSKLFFEALNPVIMPYMSMLNRNGGDFIAKFEFLTKLTLSLSWPFYVILGLCAEPVILIMFGEQWAASAYFLKIICVGVLLSSSVQLVEPFMLGLGMAKPLMKVVVALSVMRIAVSLLTFQYGLITMVAATVLTLPLLRLTLFMIVMTRAKIVDYRIYMRWLKDPALLLIACSSPLVMLNLYFGENWWRHYTVASIGLCCTIVLWLLVVIKQGNAAPIFDLIKTKLKPGTT